MSKLQKLYEIQQNLKEFGVELNPELEGQLRALEEELIKNEILPVLTEKIEPALKQVQRELVLVVDYVPGEDLKVHLSRKRNLSDVLKDAVEISHKGTVVRGGLTAPRSASYGFTVRFADGTTITHSSAKQTFIEALQHMSFQKVSAFHERTFADFPLVGTRQRITEDGYKWQERVDGWWVYVNMSNDTKMAMLQQVAKFLNVDLSIEIDGEQQPEPAPMKEPNKRVLYSLNGGAPQNKRQSVYAAIKLYMRQNPLATFAQIENAFPRELQGSYGVIATMDEIHHRMELGQDAVNRYFLDEDKILTSADGIRFAVCHQWGNQFPAFQRHVETLGWSLEEVQQ